MEEEKRGIVLEGRWAPGGQDQGHYLDGLIAMQKLTMANGMSVSVFDRVRPRPGRFLPAVKETSISYRDD